MEKPKEIEKLENYYGFKIEQGDYSYTDNKLKILDLSGRMISDIKPLADFFWLEELYLQENKIRTVQPIAKLKFLHTLHLGENSLYSITALKKITSLKLLNLSNNRIKDVSALKSLTKLQYLTLYDNEVSSINTLRYNTNLEILNLRFNKITDIKSLSALNKLTFLDLGGNNIPTIEPLKNLRKLKKLYLEDNPIFKDIPEEVYHAEGGAIIDWINAGAHIKLGEVKLLLLGNTNVGKSTLLQYLKDGKTTSSDGTSTHGINYLQLDGFIENVHIHIWDFGGQEYFHATHKLFFSPGALNILLWSKYHKDRNPEKPEAVFELEYWLRCIEQLSFEDGMAPIDTIVVQNKIDQKLVDGKIVDSKVYKSSPINQIAYQNQFPNIDFHYTSINLLPQLRMDGFEELLRERIRALPNLKRLWPNHYKVYLDKIRSVTTSYISIAELAMTTSEEELEKARNTMAVFHNMGFLLFFRNIAPDIVFIQPQKLLDFLYKHILNDKVERDEGRIISSSLEQIIKSRKNLFNLTSGQVKKLLFDFNLLFSTEEKNVYYAPQFLPKQNKGWIDLFEKYHFSKRSIRIESDSYLMNLALLKLFSHYGKDIKHGSKIGDHLFWRDGLVIEKNEQLLLVRFDRNSQYFELYTDMLGKNITLQKEVVDFIISLKVINRSKRSSSDVERDADAVPHSIPIESIWENAAFKISITNDGEHYALWNDIVTTRYTQFDSNGFSYNLRDFKQYLPLNTPKMKKIFISYSKKDLKEVNKFIDHLSSLHVNGLVDSWYCTKLEAGQKWDSAIKKEFDEADIACFMISSNFMQTKYILDVEVTAAFDRLGKDPRFKIVPIYLNYCNWEIKEYNLQQFNALPYTLRPIADFKNPDMAWYIVEAQIRKMIENDLDLKKAISDSEPMGLPTDIRLIYERIISGDV